MKKLLIVTVILIMTGLSGIAQNPPHPNGGGGPGGGNTPVGGGAPLDGGFVLMAVFASGYAFKKSGKLFIHKSKN
jgi:hypothetical protein